MHCVMTFSLKRSATPPTPLLLDKSSEDQLKTLSARRTASDPKVCPSPQPEKPLQFSFLPASVISPSPARRSHTLSFVAPSCCCPRLCIVSHSSPVVSLTVDIAEIVGCSRGASPAFTSSAESHNSPDNVFHCIFW